MAKNDFDEFVKSQQTLPSDAIDWAKERDDWLGRLTDLYARIELFVQAYISSGQVQSRYDEIELNEENIGSYKARRLILRIGRTEVTLTPVGTLLIGSKGRVDVSGPAGRSRLVLVDKNATSARSLIQVTISVGGKPPPPKPSQKPVEWEWKIVSAPPAMRFLDLTQDAFYNMLLEVANA